MKNLRKAQKALRLAAARLAKITPPAEARAGHELLLKGVREYADEIDGMIAKLKSGHRRGRLRGHVPQGRQGHDRRHARHLEGRLHHRPRRLSRGSAR